MLLLVPLTVKKERKNLGIMVMILVPRYDGLTVIIRPVLFREGEKDLVTCVACRVSHMLHVSHVACLTCCMSHRYCTL